MFSSISQQHPLRALFGELVQTRLLGTAQLNDLPAARYIAGMLVDFCHVDNLYKIRNSRGKSLEDVGEMLIASNPLLEGHSLSTNAKFGSTLAITHYLLREYFPNTWRGSTARRCDSIRLSII
jgi:hypothetical protein